MTGTAKLTSALVGLDVVLLALSGVFKDDTRGVKWVLGGIGWFGFLLVTLTLILVAVAQLARRVRRRGATV